MVLTNPTFIIIMRKARENKLCKSVNKISKRGVYETI